MNTLVAVSVVCLFAVLGASAETYPEEYDKLDVDGLLKSPDKVNAFAVCLHDNTSCTEKATKLKAILLDAFDTKCSKCTETQKGIIRKAVKFLIANKPEEWQKVVQTHDPQGTHAAEFKKFLEE